MFRDTCVFDPVCSICSASPAVSVFHLPTPHSHLCDLSMPICHSPFQVSVNYSSGTLPHMFHSAFNNYQQKCVLIHGFMHVSPGSIGSVAFRPMGCEAIHCGGSAWEKKLPASEWSGSKENGRKPKRVLISH